jgi:competence protein ComGC
MKRPPAAHIRLLGSAGFTLVEGMIGLSLVAILLVNTTMLIDTTQRAEQTNQEQLDLELTTAQVLNRLVIEMMEADQEATIPQNQAPNFSSSIDYQTSLGVEDGEEVLSAPSRIWLDPQLATVVHTENPGGGSAQDIVWARHVSEFLREEFGANGADDNSNSLIDEHGLSFNIEKSSVLIRLTLRKTTRSGREITASAETRATFRN